MAQINQNSYGSQKNEIWRCPNCETINTEKKCIMCGYERARALHDNEKEQAKGRKCPKCGRLNDADAKFCSNCRYTLDGRVIPVKWIVIAALVVVALIFLLGRDNHTHSWTAATCTAPQTCTICGETTGEKANHNWKAETCTAPKTCKVCGATTGNALGHEWKDATCTEPKTCRTCGETYGTAAGHKWKEATYDAPKTCTVCKKTEGTIKDKPVETKPAPEKETIKYTWERVKINTSTVNAMVFEKTIANCSGMTIEMMVQLNYGASCENWRVWARINGKFEEVGQIYLPSGNGTVTQEIEFNSRKSFDAICITPTANGSYSGKQVYQVRELW